MSNIDKLKSAAAKAVDNFDPNMFVETRDVLALLDELEAAESRNERALELLSSADSENVWEIIGRLKVVISGDYRSEAETAAAAGKGE
ncbi:hypothetical protein ABKV41_21210 [Enterobacter roggenkampii]|uniref:hypothetical protein n=1 Tax=Enterobacter roggenkampii TaxID=1812935 RepID=UPI0032AFB984